MEDDALVRSQTASGLEASGFAVEELETTGEALQYANVKMEIPLLLIDINLGEGKSMEGIRVSRKIKRSNPDALVMLLSSHIGELGLRELGVSEADFYVEKVKIDGDVANVRNICTSVLESAKRRNLKVNWLSKENGLA